MKSLLVERILATERLGKSGFLEARGRVYTFLNPVSYLDALEQKELFGQFDGIFADGPLLVSAIRMCYGKTVSRRSFDMTSLAPELMEYACKEGKSIYIVASAQEQVENAVEIFQERYKGITIIGYRNGYFADEEEREVEARHIVKKVKSVIFQFGLMSVNRGILGVNDCLHFMI